jgi:hypothetical protein
MVFMYEFHDFNLPVCLQTDRLTTSFIEFFICLCLHLPPLPADRSYFQVHWCCNLIRYRPYCATHTYHYYYNNYVHFKLVCA